MNRLSALFAPPWSAALSLWALPALALAQAQGSSPGPSPVDSPPGGADRGAGWLWIVAALVVLAIIFWAMSSRRRRTTTP